MDGVLDLSSRRDSVETPRETPSPYATNSSYSDASPTASQKYPEHKPSSVDLHKFAISQPKHTYLESSASAPIYQHYPLHGSNETAFPYDVKPEIRMPSVAPSSAEKRIRHLDTHHISPFVLNAVAYQQQIAQAQLAAAAHHVHQESPAASPTTSSPTTTSSPQDASSVQSSGAASTIYPMIKGRDGKLARPFKAYPRDPLSISAGFTSNEAIDSQSVDEYTAFRKRILHDICESNGGTPTLSNPKMRRIAKPAHLNHQAAGSELAVSSSSSSNNILAAGFIQAAAVAAASMAAEQRSMQDAQQQLADDAEMDAKSETTNEASNMDMDGSVKDSAYFERRKKNNAAAKKSRDRRRIKEDEIAIRAAFLERENLELKVKLAAAYQHLDMLGIPMNAMQKGSP